MPRVPAGVVCRLSERVLKRSARPDTPLDTALDHHVPAFCVGAGPVLVGAGQLPPPGPWAGSPRSGLRGLADLLSVTPRFTVPRRPAWSMNALPIGDRRDLRS